MIPPAAKRRLEGLLAKRPPPRWQGARTVALCYHSVAPEGLFSSTTKGSFLQHLRWLRSRCEVIPFSQILQHAGGKRLDKPVVAITFDDGYADNFTHAFPALIDLGLPATFFVVTGLVNRDETTIRRLARFWRVMDGDIRGLTWDHITEMRSAGMEFGAHTHSHPSLARIPRAVAAAEMDRSKEELEDHLHEPITTFAYPFGDVRWDFTLRTMELVRECGFQTAAAIQFRGVRQNENRMNVPRLPILDDSQQLLEAKVDGRLDLLGVWRERIPPWLSGWMSTGAARSRDIWNESGRAG